MNEKNSFLVVDDAPDLVCHLAMLFREKSCTTQTAWPTAEMLPLMGDSPFDFLVADKRMAGMNGRHLTTQAKQIRRELHRIVHAANEMVEYAIQTVSLGAVNFLQKTAVNFRPLEMSAANHFEKIFRNS